VNEKKIIEIEERIMAQTFAKRNLTLVKGKGALVWDIEDNEYIGWSLSSKSCECSKKSS
jgi:acetylornithine/succinyldiaminopimelate/putrescine aminotransferase